MCIWNKTYFETWVLRVAGACDIVTNLLLDWKMNRGKSASLLSSPHHVLFLPVFSDSYFKLQIIQKDALYRSLYTVVIYSQLLPRVLFCQCALNLTPVGAASLQPVSPLQWASLWVLIINLHYHILCNGYFSSLLCNFLALFPPREKIRSS